MTKYETKCEKLAKRLRPMTEAQRRWIWGKLPSFTVSYRRKVYCSECGAEVVDGVCSGCGEMNFPVSPKRAVRKQVRESYYYGVETVCGGESVHRHYIVTKTATPGEEARVSWYECFRVFTSQDGQLAYQAIAVKPISYCYDQWIVGSEMKARQRTNTGHFRNRISIIDWAVYPDVRVPAWLKRLGFHDVPSCFSDWKWKQMLSTDTFAEWLNKSGHLDWMDNARYTSLKQCKRELELCDKHGYQINDIGLWIDMVEMYRRCGRDTLNAKWSRPADLQAAHDIAMRMDERRRINEKKMEVVKKEQLYAEQKGRFFGIILTDGKFTARVIGSAAEMVEEGERMHHCVGTYIEEKDSLIFTVRDSCDRRVATVEWSIKRGQVMQCRGLQNSVPEGYDQIVQLVTSGKGLIENANKVRKLKKVV